MSLRPPTPNMQGQELVQWFQRVYDAIQELEAAVGSLPTPVTSHDSLTENGGAGSHASINSHIADKSAHGVGSDLAGVDDIQELTHKTIDALKNTLSGLRHGVEVDAPTIAHGTISTIVGVSDTQTLTNKTISALNNDLSGLRHGTEVDQPTTAHGTSSAIVGIDDIQTLANKTISALRNRITGLRHGMEVDDPATAHGAEGQIVGTENSQTLYNKVVVPIIQIIGAELEEQTSGYDVAFNESILIAVEPLEVRLHGIDAFLNRELTIMNASTGNVTVTPASGETINDETSQVVPSGSSMTIVAIYNEGWKII